MTEFPALAGSKGYAACDDDGGFKSNSAPSSRGGAESICRAGRHRPYICLLALIFTPGPIVLAVTQLLMYWPLAAAGLARMMALMRVL